MTRRRHGSGVALALALVLVGIGTAEALNIQPQRPNIGPNGTFRLGGSQTLPARNFSLGMVANYPQQPLVMSNVVGGTRSTQSIVNFAATNDFLAEVGLHDRITVGVDVPMSLVRHVPINVAGTTNDFFRLGDIALYSRFNLVDETRAGVGLAITPFVEFPTGQVGHFTGDQGVNYGARVSVDTQVGPVYLVANVGYRGRGKGETVTVTGSNTQLQLDDEFTYGAGAAVDLIANRLQIVGEFTGSTVLKDFAKFENSSPMETAGALRAYFRDKTVALTVGGGAGIKNGYGAPNYRLFSGLTFTFGKTPDRIVRSIVLQGVHFDTARASLTRDAEQILAHNLAELEDESDLYLQIEGHTDDRGDPAYNQQLSKARAQTVWEYFRARGIAADRLDVTGRGESAPVVPNTSAANWARNRRVVIHITKPGRRTRQASQTMEPARVIPTPIWADDTDEAALPAPRLPKLPPKAKRELSNWQRINRLQLEQVNERDLD